MLWCRDFCCFLFVASDGSRRFRFDYVLVTIENTLWTFPVILISGAVLCGVASLRLIGDWVYSFFGTLIWFLAFSYCTVYAPFFIYRVKKSRWLNIPSSVFVNLVIWAVEMVIGYFYMTNTEPEKWAIGNGLINLYHFVFIPILFMRIKQKRTRKMIKMQIRDLAHEIRHEDSLPSRILEDAISIHHYRNLFLFDKLKKFSREVLSPSNRQKQRSVAHEDLTPIPPETPMDDPAIKPTPLRSANGEFSDIIMTSPPPPNSEQHGQHEDEGGGETEEKLFVDHQSKNIPHSQILISPTSSDAQPKTEIELSDMSRHFDNPNSTTLSPLSDRASTQTAATHSQSTLSESLSPMHDDGDDGSTQLANGGQSIQTKNSLLELISSIEIEYERSKKEKRKIRNSHMDEKLSPPPVITIDIAPPPVDSSTHHNHHVGEGAPRTQPDTAAARPSPSMPQHSTVTPKKERFRPPSISVHHHNNDENNNEIVESDLTPLPGDGCEGVEEDIEVEISDSDEDGDGNENQPNNDRRPPDPSFGPFVFSQIPSTPLSTANHHPSLPNAISPAAGGHLVTVRAPPNNFSTLGPNTSETILRSSRVTFQNILTILNPPEHSDETTRIHWAALFTYHVAFSLVILRYLRVGLFSNLFLFPSFLFVVLILINERKRKFYKSLGYIITYTTLFPLLNFIGPFFRTLVAQGANSTIQFFLIQGFQLIMVILLLAYQVVANKMCLAPDFTVFLFPLFCVETVFSAHFYLDMQLTEFSFWSTLATQCARVLILFTWLDEKLFEFVLSKILCFKWSKKMAKENFSGKWDAKTCQTISSTSNLFFFAETSSYLIFPIIIGLIQITGEIRNLPFGVNVNLLLPAVLAKKYAIVLGVKLATHMLARNTLRPRIIRRIRMHFRTIFEIEEAVIRTDQTTGHLVRKHFLFLCGTVVLTVYGLFSLDGVPARYAFVDL